MANKGSDETEKLSDAMQQGTYSRSNPAPYIKMKKETTETHSSSPTKSQPHSDTQPKTEEDREEDSKPEGKKEGPSDDSFLDNALKERDEETTETHSSSPTKSQPHSDTQPKTEEGSKPKGIKEGPSGDYFPDKTPQKKDEETTRTHSSSPTKSQPHSDTQPKTEEDSKPKGKKEGSSDDSFLNNALKERDDSHFHTQPKTEEGSKPKGIKEGPSGDYLPDKTPKKKDEETTGTHSSSPTKSQPHSDTQPKTEEDSKPEGKKEGSSDDSFLDNALKERDEETTETHSSSPTESQPHSDTQPKTEEGSKPKGKKEGPSGDYLPDKTPKKKDEETAGDINEEDVEMDESKFQDRDQNLRPQTIVPGNNKTLWICAVGVILLAVVSAFMHSPDKTQPKPNDFNVVEVFNKEMDKLYTSFPNQHPELWRRSRIHLRRHLKTKNPSEPVSLILTSGHRAEKTLGCLAQFLARAFSTARNSSVLNINGKSKAAQDSDQVKLEIDRELRNAFEGEKSAAVIHRFEELPPGSTLIFYRYCDHENAAYKNVFLAFTVMLDAEVEVPSNVSLRRVEEMVQEHIKHKFVSSDKSAMFNQMDVDKLSGLWSRISHLILPVAAEEKIEQQGCGDSDKSV